VTTDDPVDSLEYHRLIATEEQRFKVLPAWRPDKVMNIFKPDWTAYIAKLADVSGVLINGIKDLRQAITIRMDHFAQHGCVLADHGLEIFYYATATEAEVDIILKKALLNQELSKLEIAKFHTHVQKFLAKEYAARNWVMQMHINAVRDLNTPAFNQIGVNTGHDAVADLNIAEPLRQFFDDLEKLGEAEGTTCVPRTILYSLNAKDYVPLITLGSTHLQDIHGSGVKQKFQLGAAWWFNDTRTGMLEQLRVFAEGSLLGNFVGMLTDSRSFLSYTRHEYFRRVLCDFLAGLVERGQIPNNLKLVGKLVEDISYNNAKSYFDL
jgi:glucuronate isomerase